MLQKDFNKIGNHTEEYQLSVVLMADSFFYGIFDQEGKLMAHHSYLDIFYSDDSVCAILQDAYLKQRFDRVHVVTIGSNAHQLAVPDDVFIQSLPSLAWQELFKENLPGQQIYNYFGVTPAQLHLLDQLFGDQEHQIHDFLYVLTSYYIGIDKALMHLHVEGHLISIFVQKEGKIHFFNTFRFTTEKDVLYFVMAVFNFASLNPKTDLVNFTGWVDPKSAIITLLESYIKNIKVLNDNDFIVYSKESHSAQYFIHFANRLCGS